MGLERDNVDSVFGCWKFNDHSVETSCIHQGQTVRWSVILCMPIKNTCKLVYVLAGQSRSP